MLCKVKIWVSGVLQHQLNAYKQAGDAFTASGLGGSEPLPADPVREIFTYYQMQLV
jgi:hypothetical protein